MNRSYRRLCTAILMVGTFILSISKTQLQEFDRLQKIGGTQLPEWTNDYIRQINYISASPDLYHLPSINGDTYIISLTLIHWSGFGPCTNVISIEYMIQKLRLGLTNQQAIRDCVRKIIYMDFAGRFWHSILNFFMAKFLN